MDYDFYKTFIQFIILFDITSLGELKSQTFNFPFQFPVQKSF